ncbi:MAG: ABC transporter permease [Planctomycetota bacterium]|nr:MAG: ABC transporter permease [Planctomycetota bacterium]
MGLFRALTGGLPLRYTLGNLVVRRTSVFFTAMGVALTVAVFAGVISLRNGFHDVYKPRGESALGIYLRPGATSEGESGLPREMADTLAKERAEIEHNAEGRPLAAVESYLAVYMNKVGGGVTNVPLRGVQPMTVELHGDVLKLADGRWVNWGADEVVVGKALTERIEHCRVGDTLVINTTPFIVVGVFEHPGVYGGEVWGDVERMNAALERPFFSRVIARLKPGVDAEAVRAEVADSKRYPVKFQTEREYLQSQTQVFGFVLLFLATFLTAIMGIAAILGAINTMLASVGSRTHEIGVLLALGYPRRAVFFAFLLESLLLGLLGGALGVLLVLPFNGMQTGAMNWQTFTDISFEFRVTAGLLGFSVFVALVLGLVGGVLPALRAARMRPVEALRAL